MMKALAVLSVAVITATSVASVGAQGAPPRPQGPGRQGGQAQQATAAAKTVYRLRCQTAEWVNALARNRGLYQMPVRGRLKCRTVALMYAITHNLMQAIRLRTKEVPLDG